MDWLGRAVLELLLFDSAIPSDQALYIFETGQPVYFRDIHDTEKICLPALLTGCWDYAVMNTPDNAVGRETIQNLSRYHVFGEEETDSILSIAGFLVIIPIQIPRRRTCLRTDAFSGKR